MPQGGLPTSTVSTFAVVRDHGRGRPRERPAHVPEPVDRDVVEPHPAHLVGDPGDHVALSSRRRLDPHDVRQEGRQRRPGLARPRPTSRPAHVCHLATPEARRDQKPHRGGESTAHRTSCTAARVWPRLPPEPFFEGCLVRVLHDRSGVRLVALAAPAGLDPELRGASRRRGPTGPGRWLCTIAPRRPPARWAWSAGSSRTPLCAAT